MKRPTGLSRQGWVKSRQSAYYKGPGQRVEDVSIQDLHAEGPRIGMDVSRGGDWFVPGWLFEYSGRHYSSMPDWDDVLRRWLAISEALSVEEPEWILALALSRTKLLPKRLESAEITGAMRAFFRHVEVSRRTVFWFVLHYLLSHTQDPRAKDDLVAHLFPERADGGVGECGACSGWKCTGATFPTVAEAQRAARDYPGWFQTGRKLRSPSGGRSR